LTNVTGADYWGATGNTATYPGISQILGTVRDDVAVWFRTQLFGPDVVERAVLVVSELSSNAVQAAPGHPFEVTLGRIDVDTVAIGVSNATSGDTPPPQDWAVPLEPLALRGRGLAIVAALSVGVDVDRSRPGRVTVVARMSG
jgi:anti-sigma regulatory factor (Ser/Thr protein kinase)